MINDRQRGIGAAAFVLALAALAACGDDSDTSGSGGGAVASTGATTSQSASTTSSGPPTSATQGSSGSGTSGGSGGDGSGTSGTGGGGTGGGGTGGDGTGGEGSGASGMGGAGTGGDGTGGLAGLPPGISELDGTGVDQTNEDLAAFGAMVDGAAIVGLGESVHTSGGFYAAKHRLIRYLVEEKGFRDFAMETPRTLAETTAHYVATCEGTAQQALTGFFSVFGDTNTLALFQWLCEYNAEHADDPVRFYGFDVQQPEDDRAALEAFLDAAAPDVSDALLDPIDESCRLVFDVSAIDSMDRRDCLEALDDVDAYVDANEASLIEARGADQLAIDRLSILGLRSWEDEVFFYESNAAQSYEARDAAMAQVFETLRGPDSLVPTIVWAHDFHLRRRSDESTAYPVIHALGARIFDVHGDAYRPFGITSMRTGINWPGYGCDDDAFPPRPGSIEARFQGELGASRSYLVDLEAVTSGAAPWLAPATSIPYGLDGRDVLEDQFRGLVVLDASPGMDALFWACTP